MRDDELRVAIERAERLTKQLSRLVLTAREELRRPYVHPRVDVGSRCPVVGCGAALVVQASDATEEDRWFEPGACGVWRGKFRGQCRSRCEAGHVVTVELTQ